MQRAYLSLGSNQGDRLEFLRRAVTMLRDEKEIHNIRQSRVYETAPWGYTEQPPFLNMMVSCDATLTPVELLHIGQDIEARCRRTRGVRWGPRTLDIDIITFGDITCESPKLTLPHPRAHERAFVLKPWLDLDPRARLDGRYVADLLEDLSDQQPVKLYCHTL